jgi:hypothetical protein
MLAAVALAGCGPAPVTQPPTMAVGTTVPSAVASSEPPASPVARVDASLLDLLPPEVAGVALAADAATAADIATGGSLAPSVVGVAVAAAFGPQATDTNLDYVVVTLARLEPGVLDDTYFRDWRDSFDEAVCEQTGGIEGHAEAEIAGHQTFITTCAGGVRTYHVYLSTSNVVVSMQAAGEGRYGELVVRGLRE